MAASRYYKSAIYLGTFTGLGYFLMLAVEPDVDQLKEKLPERDANLKSDQEKRNQGLMNVLKATSQGLDVTKAVELEKQKLKIEQEKRKLLEEKSHSSVKDE